MGRKSKPSYYAVARGRKTGIFRDWSACEDQVSGFPNSRFKGFFTEADALQFIADFNERESRVAEAATQDQTVHESAAGQARPPGRMMAPKKRTAELDAVAAHYRSTVDETAAELTMDEEPIPAKRIKTETDTTKSRGAETAELGLSRDVDRASDPSEAGYTVVYTDGSSIRNGTVNAAAGVGVYFGPGDPRNVSARLQGEQQTNNRAELTAIIRALEAVPERVNLMIKTDSQYAIKCLTIWHHQWSRNGWCSQVQGDVLNKDLILRGLELIQPRSGKTKFVKVKAHAGTFGNEIADRLANEGAAKEL